MLRNLLLGKINIFEFRLFRIKSLEKGKMALTFAYDVENKRIIYQNVQNENPHPILTAYGLFANF